MTKSKSQKSAHHVLAELLTSSPVFVFDSQTHITSKYKHVRKSDEDVDDLDEDVYCSIAVTKYMLYLGFNGVGMNPLNPKS